MYEAEMKEKLAGEWYNVCPVIRGHNVPPSLDAVGGVQVFDHCH